MTVETMAAVRTREFFLAVAVMTPTMAGAADVQLKGTEDETRIFMLQGPIRKGDLAQLQAAGLTPDDILSMHSDGGDFREGMALARFIHENRISTIVEDGRRCLSACALAFLGGATDGEEEGIVVPSRSIAPGGRLAFHAPFLNLPEATYDKQQVEASYDRAVETIIDFIQMDRYLQIAPGDAAELMRPQRLEFKYLDTAGLLNRYKVAVQGLEAVPHLTPTMAASMCANGWNAAGHFKLNITVEDNPDVFAETKRLMAAQGWNAKKASFDNGDNTVTTVVPVAAAMEGATFYCTIDHIYTEFGNLLGCAGYSTAETLTEAIDNVRSGFATDLACGSSLVVDPVLGYDVTSQAFSRKLVPPDTPLTAIDRTLRDLLATEEPIPAPGP